MVPCSKRLLAGKWKDAGRRILGSLQGMMLAGALFAMPAASGLKAESSIPSPSAYGVVFEHLREQGLKAGDRGAAKPNLFAKYLDTYAGLDPSSQDFVLYAYGEVRVEGQGGEVSKSNARLAANLILMMRDIEALAQYLETGQISEDGPPQIASDDFQLLQQYYPHASHVISPELGARIDALEAAVLERVQADNERLRQQIERKKLRNQKLDEVNAGLEALLRALGK